MSLSSNHIVYRLYVTHYIYVTHYVPTLFIERFGATHGYTGAFLFGSYENVHFKYDWDAIHQFGVHFQGMVKKLAWESEVEDGWEPYPGSSMVYERSSKISKVTEEEPQQAECHALSELDLVKYGWQN
jgi:hypothetical protein